MVKPINNKRRDLTALGLYLITIILLNFIGTKLFFRLDLTSENRYTLSKATKQMVKDLDDVVFVRVYLDGDLPAGFKRLRNSTKELLDELRAVSSENIQYEFIDPSADPDPKVRNDVYRQLSKMGLQYTNLEYMEGDKKLEKIIFPGAMVAFKSKEIPLQLLKSKIGANPEVMLNNSVQQLEFEIANTIRKLTIDLKPKIAFIEGHGELKELEVKDITSELSQFYNVERIRINKQLNALDKVDAIIIAKPDSLFDEKDKFIIDQFVMRGGKCLWLIDQLKVNHDSLQKNSFTFAIGRSLNIDDQLFKYGARINSDLVLDLQSSPIPVVLGYIGNQPQQKLFPWYFYPLVIPISDNPLVKNLNAVRFQYGSSVDTIAKPGIKKTFLLHSSKYTKMLNSPVRVSLNILRDEPQMEQYNKTHVPMAVLLEGEFESIYKNRLPQNLLENNLIKFKELSEPTKMIVIGDGDLIRNDIVMSTGKPYPLGYDRFSDNIYANKNFILNCMNYLLDDSGLISVRGKEIQLRLLDKGKLAKEKAAWQFLNIFVPILLVIVSAILLFFIRKRKYA